MVDFIGDDVVLAAIDVVFIGDDVVLFGDDVGLTGGCPVGRTGVVGGLSEHNIL